MIKTVDSDVVIMAIRNFQHLIHLDELWIEFGAGKSLRFIPVHQIATTLGPDKSEALIFLHAFSGCDTTSTLSGKGKKMFYETWSSTDEITNLFKKLPAIVTPDDITIDEFQLIEHFVVKLYSKTCNTTEVNTARRILFSRDNKPIENIPPTKESLLQHVLRAVLQSSKWEQSLCKEYDNRNPCEWGWQNIDGKITPVWTRLPEASRVCRELLKCGCKKGCTGRCKF